MCKSAAPGTHKFRFTNKLLTLDSTTISLCLSLFPWAKFRRSKGAVKLHLLLDHDGYLPTYPSISEGKRHDVTVARRVSLGHGSIVVIDRGYSDYSDTIKGKRRLWGGGRLSYSHHQKHRIRSTHSVYWILCPENLSLYASESSNLG